VVGFIGPEYLYDGKQITRAGLASDESPVQELREASLRRETACASGRG